MHYFFWRSRSSDTNTGSVACRVVRLREVWCEAKYYKKQNGFPLRKCVYDAVLCKLACIVSYAAGFLACFMVT